MAASKASAAKKPAVKKASAEPKAAAKPRAAKKPAKQDDVATLTELAEKLEADLQTIVSAAGAAGNWQPHQADQCSDLAAAIVDARGQLAKATGSEYVPGDNLTRWL